MKKKKYYLYFKVKKGLELMAEGDLVIEAGGLTVETLEEAKKLIADEVVSKLGLDPKNVNVSFPESGIQHGEINIFFPTIVPLL